MEATLARALADALGAAVSAAQPVAGGDVNRAWRVELADGRTVFVKHHGRPPSGFFRAEADGLAWLAAARALPVPAVCAVLDAPAALALEWIERGPPAPDHDERLGRGLAALHRAGAPAFGADRDNYIGPLPQPNAPCASWAAFYGERRLAPLVRRARDAGRLAPATVRRVDRLVARLDELVGPSEPPARLHGDLWSGNVLCGSDGAPRLVDPAAYGGHREVDLAMMRLFGGFGPRCFAAYAEAFPLAAGWEERVALYQLHPLLVHVNLFGGGYVSSFEAALARALRGGPLRGGRQG